MSARPLAGRRIAVTRSAERAPALVDTLVGFGADVVSVPTIGVVLRAPDEADVEAVRSLAEGDLLAVTSANGVRALRLLGVVPQCPIVAVGTATAAALTSEGLAASVVPATQTAEALAAAVGPGRGRVVFLAAAAAGTDLEQGLSAGGWRVDRRNVYDTDLVQPPELAMRAANRCEAVVFTSGSTARGWVSAGGSGVAGVSIGPKTTAVARDLGIDVVAEAVSHDVEGIVDSLLGVVASRGL